MAKSNSQFAMGLLVTSILFAGCNPTEISSGSDSGSTSGSGSTSEATTSADLLNDSGTEELSGRVADGYLVGATVCLDLNNSDTCDEGEPQGVSGKGGTYTITGATEEQIKHGKILVVADENTVDEDTGQAVDGDFVLTALPGEGDFVSPISTLVQTALENDPALTVDMARELVATSLGLDESEAGQLGSNYIEVGAGENASKAATMRKLGQLLTRIQSKARTEMKTEFQPDSGLDDVQFNRLARNIIQTYIDDQFDALKDWSEANADEDLNVVDAEAINIVNAIVSSDKAADTFKERADYAEAGVDAKPVTNSVAILDTGFYEVGNLILFDGEIGEVDYGFIQKGDNFLDGEWLNLQYESGSQSAWSIRERRNNYFNTPQYYAEDKSAREVSKYDFGGRGIPPYSVYSDSLQLSYEFHDNDELTFRVREFLNGQTVVDHSSRLGFGLRVVDVAGRKVSWWASKYMGESLNSSATFPAGSQFIFANFDSSGGTELQWLNAEGFYEDVADGEIQRYDRNNIVSLSDLGDLYIGFGGYDHEIKEIVMDGYLAIPASFEDSSGSLTFYHAVDNRAEGTPDPEWEKGAETTAIPYSMVTLGDGMKAIQMNTGSAIDVGLEANLISVVVPKDPDSYLGGAPEGYTPTSEVVGGTTLMFRKAAGQHSYTEFSIPSFNKPAFDAVADALNIPASMRL